MKALCVEAQKELLNENTGVWFDVFSITLSNIDVNLLEEESARTPYAMLLHTL